ncbi:LmeA family phospholipid-binding protein [Kribbella sp. WER1]
MSPSRQGRGLRRLVVTLIVLVVLLVAVDRIAAVVAQNQLASMAQKEAAKYQVRSADVSAKIGGFGFLPQLIKQDFSKVTLTMGKPAFAKIPGENLTVDMKNVHVPRSLLFGQSGTVTVGTTDMQVRFSPRELGRLAVKTTNIQGLSVESVGSKLHLKYTGNGLNLDVPVTPQLQDGKIALQLADQSGSLPAALKSLAGGIELPKLPYNAQLTQVSVQDNAVVLNATVKDLSFTR